MCTPIRVGFTVLAIVFGFVAAVLVMINVQLVMKILAKQKRAKRGKYSFRQLWILWLEYSVLLLAGYEPVLEKTALLGR